jgi:hypothetical protein
MLRVSGKGVRSLLYTGTVTLIGRIDRNDGNRQSNRQSLDGNGIGQFTLQSPFRYWVTTSQFCYSVTKSQMCYWVTIRQLRYRLTISKHASYLHVYMRPVHHRIFVFKWNYVSYNWKPAAPTKLWRGWTNSSSLQRERSRPPHCMSSHDLH